MNEPTKRRPKLTILLIVLLLAAIGMCVYFFIKYQDASKTPESEQAKILQSISVVLQLPDEKPTSFTIADKSKLTNQALASRVENGDTLFMFPSTKKLVVYRPSSQKVIDILSVDANAQLPTTTP